MRLKLLILAALGLPSWSAQAEQCLADTMNAMENNVGRAYVAYYGRPADPGGLRYWAERLSDENGNLASIIEDFGNSQEFNERYGGLSPAELIDGLYQQLFGRKAEPAGLDYWADELASGRRSLQSITLDVLFGAAGSDAVTSALRLDAARHFTLLAEQAGDATRPERFDAAAMSAVLASVDTDADSAARACASYAAMLDGLGARHYAQVYTVTSTADSGGDCSLASCSLAAAITAANNSGGSALIQLPAGRYRLDSTIAGLLVHGDVHVQGAGAEQTVIEGNGSNRLFWLESSSARLSLSGLSLSGGRYDFGGALLNKGQLTLDRVTLEDNVSPSNGGAVLNTGTLYAFNTVWRGNEALGSGFGGALFNEGGDVHLFASRLDDNRAGHSGGAVFNSGRLYGAEIDFSANTTADVEHATGGAIETPGTVIFNGARFNANAANDGGAIGVRNGGSVRISRGEFIANLAFGLDLGGGGALFNYQGSAWFNDVLFQGNLANGEGGGAIQNRGPLEIVDGRFEGNKALIHDSVLADSADGLGGAILVIETSTVLIRDSLFNNNTAGTSGGAIYNDGSTQLVIEDSTLRGNLAEGLFKNGNGGYGGAIHNEGGLELVRSLLTGNTVNGSGGAISFNQASSAQIRDTTVDDNRALNGGGLAVFTGTLNIHSSTIRNNFASQPGNGFGGGLLIDRAEVELNDTEVSRNRAAIGGGFSNNSGGTVRATGSTLAGNTASVDGSAFVNFAPGRVELRTTTVSGSYRNHPGANLIDRGGNVYN